MMQRQHEDSGSITAFVVMLMMTFVACAGLAVDGGRMVAAKVQLADQAENAARAGTQEITALRTGVLASIKTSGTPLTNSTRSARRSAGPARTVN